MAIIHPTYDEPHAVIRIGRHSRTHSPVKLTAARTHPVEHVAPEPPKKTRWRKRIAHDKSLARALEGNRFLHLT